MTNHSPGLSRRRARESRIGGARIAPTIRPLAGADLFAWIDLYAAFLEEMGMPYRDDAALRTWRELGLADDAEPLPGVEAIVAERSGNLVGYAVSQPSMSTLDGRRRLDVPALYVERLDHDGQALEALLEALHRRAAEVGADRLRWEIPEAAHEARHRCERLGARTDDCAYEMPVQRP